MTDRTLILLLSERVYILSQLLGCAAERLSWNAEKVQDLVRRLEEELAGVKKCDL